MSILLCLVLAVPDGDSLRAQCEGRERPISVRLRQIDAPELKHSGFARMDEQPFGKLAQQRLSNLCYKQQAVVHTYGLDRYRRTLASVECQGVNANESQVRDGLAWPYQPVRGSVIPQLAKDAKAAGVGLWSMPNPIPPSEWRKGVR